MFVKRSVKNAVLAMMLAVSFFGSGTIQIKAAWGDLDAGFGNAGTFYDTKPNNYANDVLIQPDGKILVAGYSLASNGKWRFLLRRLTASGAIDTTFGSGGTAVLGALINPNTDYTGGRIALLSGGKIAVIGQADIKVCLWVFNSNGYADTNFGNGGMKIMFEYWYPWGRIGANGTKIIFGAYHLDYNRLIIHQLNADGSNDTSFGSEGRSYTGLFDYTGGAEFDMVTGQSQNKITIGGVSNHPQYGRMKRIERINQDGSIDFTFTPIQTEFADPGIFRGFARLSGGDLAYSISHKVGLQWMTKLYKMDWNGTTVSQWIDANASLISLQSNGNAIFGIGSHYLLSNKISRYDALFNFLDTAPTTDETKYVGATQRDNKVVIVSTVDTKLVLTRWMAN